MGAHPQARSTAIGRAPAESGRFPSLEIPSPIDGSGSRGGGSSARAVARDDERLFQWWDFPLYGFLTALNLGSVAVVTWWWSSSHANSSRHLAFTLLLSLPPLIGILMYESRWMTLPMMRRPRHRPAPPGWRVGVATTFVAGAESIEMLEKTVRALIAMTYPHDTWVLDEGGDDSPELEKLCQRWGARYFSRWDRPEYQAESGAFASRTKHGNYNAWLTEVGYEAYDLIVNFDPDHIPVSGFLDRVLGHFDDPAVGYVQAPQTYYNQPASLVARGAAEETYAYYSSIQMTAQGLGYPIVTGCHTAHRARALRDVGGFAAHDADDLLITLYYRAARWRGVYVPDTLAEGLVPVDWPAYLAQQRRWARSVLDVKLRLFSKLAGRLPVVERVASALHGLYYLHGLGSALAVVLLSYMLVTGRSPFVMSASTMLAAVAFFAVFESCEFYRQRFYLNVRSEAGLHWRGGVLRFAKWPVVLLALIDVVARKPVPYAITPKTDAARRSHALVRLHLLPVAMVAVAWTLGMMRGVVETGLLHGLALGYVCASVLLMATELALPAPSFDPDLADRRSTAGRS